MFLVREGNAQDFRAYIGGQEYPRAWCKGSPEGLIAYDENNQLVAIALVTIDEQDRTWIWFSQKNALPAIILHRQALELLESLCASGRAVHAFADPHEHSAENWLKRLGFIPTVLMPHPSGEERTVWIRR